MPKAAGNKKEMFESMPVPKALMSMAVPTIISQLITLIYNMVDAFFIGQTGNSFMVAAISLTLTLVIMLTSLSNLFGVGGGSLTARLMGVSQEEEARRVSAGYISRQHQHPCYLICRHRRSRIPHHNCCS